MSIDTKTWAGYFKDILVINFLFDILKYRWFEGFKKLSVDASTYEKKHNCRNIGWTIPFLW